MDRMAVGSLGALSLLLVALGCGGDDAPAVRDDMGFVFRDTGTDARRSDGQVDGGRDARTGDAAMRDGGGGRLCADLDECGDGVDGDCDGVVDQRCPCVPGDVRQCFRGDPTHRGLGACRDGRMVCLGSLEFGTWGPCEDDVVEADEVCDGAGGDEDCDGAPNDGCECVEGDPDLPCGTSLGACERGFQRCVSGTRTECEGAVGPSAEICNGVDDDCDGTTDEDLTRPCGSDLGACRPGTETCRDGEWATCAGGVRESAEVCNGVDDDCDGMTDEGAGVDCGTDVGACRHGRQECEDGSLGACDAAIGPTAETCNGEDDDCDGMTDEDLVRACGSDVGECSMGMQRCDDAKWAACVGATDPVTEVCEGARDEDCDGAVDEGCGCAAGATRGCGTDVGACVAGMQLCDATGMWGSCTGATGPTAESCNGVDDDCDGMTDEGCGCVAGATRPCGSDVGSCVAGTTTCDAAGVWGPCAGEIPPAGEICNTLDDDCDGAIDEDDVCPRVPPTVSCPGAMSVTAGTAVTLTGSGADPDGGSVTFAWSVATAPVGSTAAPIPPGDASTTFTADVAGAYTLRLCATDDEAQTACCTTTLDATSTCAPLPPPTVTSCGTSWDRRPILEFTPVPAGVVYELYRSGVATPYATVSTAGHVYHRPSTELSAGADPPGEVAQLYVKACRVGEPACCSVSNQVTVALVSACDTPIGATAENVVFSEYLINARGPLAGDEQGEAIEITNLSHCPVALNGTHFAYRHRTSMTGSFTYRWMDFGMDDVIPPRGVYVAVRDRASSMCTFPSLGAASDDSLFGLRISGLTMMGPSIGSSGWFNNNPTAESVLRIATGTWASAGMTLEPADGRTIEIVQPYLGTAPECSSIGFDAIGACGDDLQPTSPSPTAVLTPNQLGRLWRPCDAVTSPASGSGCP